jgi:Domain of unknown function (DUF1330)
MLVLSGGEYALQVEKPMPAYWVARSKVNDPAEYKKYADQVPPILAKYGGSRWPAVARGPKKRGSSRSTGVPSVVPR